MYNKPTKKSHFYFNPRSREGSDSFDWLQSVKRWKFQSTLPRGERRLTAAVLAHNSANFNPRSREGSDHWYYHESADD